MKKRAQPAPPRPAAAFGPHPYAAAFAGAWVGETQGCAMPAHLWEIRPQTNWLRIASRWENDPKATTITATLVPGEAAFLIGPFKATLIDPLHFVIAGWDTNDTRQREGPAYDVVFSRSGLAELTAGRAYQKYLQQQREQRS